ncbi:MAG: hypothetical protein JWP31_1980, partial [Aeromicrobium sp.]|nr:hypothetical protein [Aeromicrobium sp.]
LGYRETRRRSADEVIDRNELALRSYDKVVSLISAHQADEAEAYWRTHMAAVLTLLDDENDATQTVIDVLE